jgi:membrane protease YdiL (CAAX protease family)
MMPAGMGSPTDSVAAPVERQHIGVLTALSALLLVAFIALMAWLSYSGSRMEAVDEPERALALVVGRTMDLDDAIRHSAGLERFFYRLTSSDPAEDLREGIRWYEELADASVDPAVDLHLAVLEGEAGRLDRVRRRAAEWALRPDPLPAFGRLVVAAYLGDEAGAMEGVVVAETLERGLEPGWFRDRIAGRLAARAGDGDALAAIAATQAARSARLLARMRVVIALEVALLAVAVLVLLRLSWRHGLFERVGAAILPPPWRGRQGVVVLVQGGALGVVTLAAVYVYSAFGPEHSRWFNRVMFGLVTNLAFVPVLILADRRLVRPAGMRFGESFGLVPVAGGVRNLGLVLLALLGVGQLVEGAMDFAGRWLGLSSHWTEWFDPDLAWGPRIDVAAAILDAVVVTPVFEEIVFRGLLFATLRRRFGTGAAAVLSAAIFAIAHGYGVLGFAAVFWSGLLWAFAYERTGSLLPSMAAHAADNLMASLGVILALRA